MRARSLAVAVAAVTMLLAGCATVTEQSALPPWVTKPWLRDMNHRVCPPARCDEKVDPDKSEWVRENIDVLPGSSVNFTIASGWEFDDPPIRFKPGAPPGLACPPRGKLEVTCTLTSDPKRKIGYTIYAKRLSDGKSFEYDPFIWPK